MRTSARAGFTGSLVTPGLIALAGLIALGDLAGLLASDPVTPQRLAALAVAVLAVVATGCVAVAVRVERTAGRRRACSPGCCPT